MKAISIGKRYEIHEDSLKAYDKLPVNTYTVRFDKMSGFYLEHAPGLPLRKRCMGFTRKRLTRFSKHSRCLSGIWASSSAAPKGSGSPCLPGFCPLRRRMPAIPHHH